MLLLSNSIGLNIGEHELLGVFLECNTNAVMSEQNRVIKV